MNNSGGCGEAVPGPVAGIGRLTRDLEVSGWGIGEIGRLAANRTGFTRAISLYAAHDIPPSHDPMLGGEYSEEAFHSSLLEAQSRVRAAATAIGELLEAAGVHWSIPEPGQDPVTLEGVFPHKLAATRAGLGWIGRCSLLVTPRHGPRVVLHTVLLDHPLPAAVPLDAQMCGTCTACVDACPHGFISGRTWEPGLDRDLLLDARGCSDARVEMGEPLGRKHECGLCMLMCPVGRWTL